MVREVGYDSSSPDPHCRRLTRGSPSPTAPHFRRAPPSLGLCKGHRRRPSLMSLSTPDLDDYSSTEEGEAMAAAVPEEIGKQEGLISAASSGFSTLSSTTAVLLCQEAMAASGQGIRKMKLASSDSVCSISSPSLGVQEVSVGLAGEHSGGVFGAGDVMSEPLVTVCHPPSLLSIVELTSTCDGRAVNGDDDGQGFELLKMPALTKRAVVGSAVASCAPYPVEADCDVQCTTMAVDDLLCSDDTVNISHFPLSSIVAGLVDG
ncbi:hypothetical protein Dimus_013502 [Dionaea muscipula]